MNVVNASLFRSSYSDDGQKKRKHLYSSLKVTIKSKGSKIMGQSKSLHGKPFPTASQFQGQSRFGERW